MTKKEINQLAYGIIGAAIEVHKILGPGLLEAVYHKCLEKELSLRGIQFLSEHKIPYSYKGIKLDVELRCDFLIEDSIVVELKSVDSILPVHKAQLLTYMKLLDAPKGLLINFNVDSIYHDGQQSFVNELFRLLPDN